MQLGDKGITVIVRRWPGSVSPKRTWQCSGFSATKPGWLSLAVSIIGGSVHLAIEVSHARRTGFSLSWPNIPIRSNTYGSGGMALSGYCS
jgi:hypothetical protein